MSFQAIAWAWEQVTGSPGRKAVLMSLAQFADERGICWPSQAYVATYTEQSPRTVREHLAALEAGGFIERRARFGKNGQQTSDIIRLRLEKPSARRLQPVSLDGIATGEAMDPPANFAAPTPGENFPAPRQFSPTPPAKSAAEPVIEPINEPEKKKKKKASTQAQAIDFDFERGEFVGPVCDLFGRLQDAFPAIDVKEQAKRAACWLIANPANRKSNYTRFLTNWMNRAQDKAPRVTGNLTHGGTAHAPRARTDRFAHADAFAAAVFGRDAHQPEPFTIDV